MGSRPRAKRAVRKRTRPIRRKTVTRRPVAKKKAGSKTTTPAKRASTKKKSVAKTAAPATKVSSEEIARAEYAIRITDTGANHLVHNVVSDEQGRKIIPCLRAHLGKGGWVPHGAPTISDRRCRQCTGAARGISELKLYAQLMRISVKRAIEIVTRQRIARGIST